MREEITSEFNRDVGDLPAPERDGEWYPTTARPYSIHVLQKIERLGRRTFGEFAHPNMQRSWDVVYSHLYEIQAPNDISAGDRVMVWFDKDYRDYPVFYSGVSLSEEEASAWSYACQIYLPASGIIVQYIDQQRGEHSILCASMTDAMLHISNIGLKLMGEDRIFPEGGGKIDYDLLNHSVVRAVCPLLGSQEGPKSRLNHCSIKELLRTLSDLSNRIHKSRDSVIAGKPTGEFVDPFVVHYTKDNQLKVIDAV